MQTLDNPYPVDGTALACCRGIGRHTPDCAATVCVDIDGSEDVETASYTLHGVNVIVGFIRESDGTTTPKTLCIDGSAELTCREQLDDLMYLLATAGDAAFGDVSVGPEKVSS